MSPTLPFSSSLSGAPRLALLVYDDRSGSTFLAAELSKIPGVGVTIESDFLRSILKSGITHLSDPVDAHALFDELMLEAKFRDWGVCQDDLQLTSKEISWPLSVADFICHIVGTYFFLREVSPSLIILKQGDIDYIGGVSRLLPAAPVIHIVRDGRAVYASKRAAKTSSDARPMAACPVTSAIQWSARVGGVRAKVPKSRLYELRYESLLNSLDSTISELRAWLELGSAESSGNQSLPGEPTLSYASRIPETQRHLHKNIGAPPLKERIDAWRTALTREDIYLFERTAADELSHWGYPLLELSNARPTLSHLQLEFALYKRSVRRATRQVAWYVRRLLKLISNPKRLGSTIRVRSRESRLRQGKA